MWRQTFLAMFANIGSFYFGSTAAWSSPSMTFIVENKGYPFWVTKKQYGFIVAAMSLGAMISTIPTGIIRHKYGTKRTMMIFAVPSTIGAVLITIPQNIYMLTLGRFLIGTAVGCYLFLIQIYVGEISSTRNRGTFLNFIHIFVHLGIVFMYTLSQFVSHRTLNIIYGSIPLFYAVAFQAMIETPPYLASKGKYDKAKNSLFSIRESKKVFEAELLEINKSGTVQVDKKSFRDLLQIKAIRRGMIVMCMQFFFFQMSGINAVNFYAQSIFMEAGMKHIHPGVASIIYVSFLTIFSFSASIAARHFDRRVMICIFATLNCICLFIIGSYYNVKDFGYDIDAYRWIPLVALCVNSIAFCHGTALVTWALIGELFTLEAKKVIAPIGQIVSHALTFVIVLSFPSLVIWIGTGNVFYIFAAATFIDIIFAYFFIPETRGKTIQEIQEALEK